MADLYSFKADYGGNPITLTPQQMQQAEVLRRNRFLQDIMSGRPDRPEWQSMMGGDNGLLQNQYQMQDMYNQDALNAMRAEASHAPGQDSAWRQAQQAKLMQDASSAQAQAQSQSAIAANQSAMRGGLSGGSAERMANRAAQQGLQARQGVLAQGTNLDIQDEQNRLNAINQTNQANLGAAQQQQGVQQFNIQNALNEFMQKRYSDLQAYKDEMSAWGAKQTAAATPSGGGKK